MAFRLLCALALFAFTAIPTMDAEAARCGAENQQPCKIWERIPSCDTGLVENFAKGRCVKPVRMRPGIDCGALNKRPCKVWERIPSCNSGLVESFTQGKCVKPAVAGVDCGNVNQRPCKIWERIPSCNANLKEHFTRGICVAVACGKNNGRPCTVVERIPSCDQGLVEDFLQNRCIPSKDYARHELATKKLAELASFIAGKMTFASQIAANPSVTNSLTSSNPQRIANAVNKGAVGATNMPDGHLIRTMTIGATVGAKVIIGGSAGAGAAIDLTGRRPAYAYATADRGWSLGFEVATGVDVGFWVCQNNKIGGDSWGVEFSPLDLVAANKLRRGRTDLKDMAAKGPDLGIALWFGYDDVFQGFTITPGFAAGIDFGGVAYAGTVVQDDPRVNCDGTAKSGGTPPPIVAPAPAPVAGGGVTLYQHCDFQGYKVQLPQGRYSLAALRRLGLRNDDISSIRVGRGSAIAIFEHDGFRGRRLNFRGDVRCLVDHQFNDVLSSAVVEIGAAAPPPSSGAPKFIQTIRYRSSGNRGAVQHSKVDGGARPGITRICLVNRTQRHKLITHGVGGINPLRAPPGGRSCANFSSRIRLNFGFQDFRTVVKRDAMNLSAYAGDIVTFEWTQD